ncbi:MAG: hypothetical protein C4310_12365, partial [Chloroflexota bacterium]
MATAEFIGPALPQIPWEERPRGSSEVVWRSQRNPILTREAVPGANSIFNSAVVPFQGKFAGVFRCDNTARDMQLHAGLSADGIHWEIQPQRIRFQCEDEEIGRFVYGYDPRVCWLEDRYYITWCNGYHGPTIGLGYTFDFNTFTQMENAFLPYNRNGVLFPRKINGKYAMLSRPSDRGHTPFGDMYYLVDGGTAWENGCVGGAPPAPEDIGHFALLECFDYPFYNTFDVGFYASFALALLWPELEKSVIRDFAAAVPLDDPSLITVGATGECAVRKRPGAVPHDLGSPREAPWLRPNAYTWQDSNIWKDLNSKFVLQVWRDAVL